MKTTEEQFKEMTENALILYEALKAITSQFKRVYPLYSKDIEIIHQAQQALAKVDAKG